jgi:hypothetical protein
MLGASACVTHQSGPDFNDPSDELGWVSKVVRGLCSWTRWRTGRRHRSWRFTACPPCAGMWVGSPTTTLAAETRTQIPLSLLGFCCFCLLDGSCAVFPALTCPSFACVCMCLCVCACVCVCVCERERERKREREGGREKVSVRKRESVCV